MNKDSIVYDNVVGTGGFLISALRKMITDAKEDLEKEKQIKSKQIVGVEFQAHIFALACTNMYIHKDGKTNIISGSCFDSEIMEQVKRYKPTIGFLNPPYKADKKKDIEELEFVLNNLEILEPGGTCIAILPMQSALAQKGKVYQLKKQLLQKHTLEAVLSMPDQLFYNTDAGVVTCVMIFTSHRPHSTNKETYFGYYKDDGFVKRKNKGRIDAFGKWENIKKEWVTSFINKKTKVGFSVNNVVTAKDEWCAEAYMDIDYSVLNIKYFKKIVLDYLSYCIFKEDLSEVKEFVNSKKTLELDTTKWKSFELIKLFRIQLGKPVHKNTIKEFSERYNPGYVPYVTRTTFNNGVELFIHEKEFTKIQEGNAITIGAEGFKAFYQKNGFVTGNKINILYNDKLNQFNTLFINSILNLEIEQKFNYGRGLVKSRLKKLSIKLPVNKNREPDFEYMETFIKSLPYSSSI